MQDVCEMNGCDKTSWLSSSVGRKQMVAVTGIGLSLFVLLHMAGNLLILVSPQKYNEYGHALVTNPGILAAEAGLLLMFFGHIAFAMRQTRANWAARDSRYAVLPGGAKRTSWTQRTLWAQGLLILVFTILHLITFKFGTHYEVDYGHGPIRDLHKLVLEVFAEPGYVAWYVVALLVLGAHLSHGVGSLFQTLGVNHPRYNGAIKCFSWLYAVVVAGGFIVQPIYVYFIH